MFTSIYFIAMNLVVMIQFNASKINVTVESTLQTGAPVIGSWARFHILEVLFGRLEATKNQQGGEIMTDANRE